MSELLIIILYDDLICLTLGDTCILEKTCTETCYRTSSYTVSCGTWGWRRCNRYRRVSYSCQQQCNEEICCDGYTGDDCLTPLCFNSTTCANGGTCVSPDNCTCTSGFSEPACDDIDECANQLDTCEHICVNTQGSYTCDCNNGYMLQPDLASCSDIDECINENGRCNQVCVNSEGSYSCACNQGYELSADELTCTDEDECANSTHECEHGCTNTVGSFGCYCHTGYELGIDDRSCDDLDECADGTSLCDHICVNTRGSYECECNAGYERQPDGLSCKDIDECSTNNGGCGQICTNHPGEYECSCFDGYRLVQQNQCEDINECSNNMQCDQTCTNSIGSFTCGCWEGYALDTNGRSCFNIDDCADITCKNNGSCIDGLSSFTCVCLPGFTGNLCELDVNECLFLNGGCNDLCMNTLGSFMCSCTGNRSLAANQRSCEGGDYTGTSVFERLRIARKRLPEGCFSFNIDDTRFLTSTLPWYCLHNDQSICYTSGVVHIKIGSRCHPISIQGLAIFNKDLLTITSNTFTYKDGSITKQETECKEIELSAKDS
ncbi:signal peptide, CUB and EGF-like domain-containing protein 2 [Mercenaria mercenaria]|uniref:signal peptide, CUB and EGF-like domain-containing protein 2 n=1 Tax=Mercenaria mercenaria TaxID=6596 RepID=UPI00234ED674|nr:signal peptide, CUB and EGF-like domain-containing protein 2 [Mercenaria mercenaria]